MRFAGWSTGGAILTSRCPEWAAPGVPGDGDSVYAFEDSITGDECPVSPRTILEAMLFVGRSTNEPLTSTQVAAMMRGVRPQEIDSLVTELNAAYDEEEGCPYGIVSTGSGYRLTFLKECAPLRDKFHGRVKEARLSQSAVDVLAIVAYRQPLTRDEIDNLRGKASGGVLAQLVRRRLLRMERRDEAPKQPHYFTTDRFLKLFGLQQLSDLPQSQDDDQARCSDRVRMGSQVTGVRDVARIGFDSFAPQSRRLSRKHAVKSRPRIASPVRTRNPAIMLMCDFGNLAQEVQRLESAQVAGLHLDIMDGQFVPNLTYGMPIVSAIRKLTELPLDVHLMIADPRRYLRDFRSAGADVVTFHVEAVADPQPSWTTSTDWECPAELL